VFDRRIGFPLEPCADVIVLAAARRSILVGGGEIANNFCFQGMHVEQLFFAVVWPQIRRIL